MLPVEIIDGKLDEDETVYCNDIEIGKILINEDYPFALIKFSNKNFNKDLILKSNNANPNGASNDFLLNSRGESEEFIKKAKQHINQQRNAEFNNNGREVQYRGNQKKVNNNGSKKIKRNSLSTKKGICYAQGSSCKD